MVVVVKLTGRKTKKPNLSWRIYPAWFTELVTLTCMYLRFYHSKKTPSLQLPDNHSTPGQYTTVVLTKIQRLNNGWGACGAPREEMIAGVCDSDNAMLP